MKNFIKYILFTLFFIGIGGILWLAFIRYILPFQLPDSNYSTILTDAHNKEIGEILSLEGKRHRNIIASNIPEFFKTALIYTEDRRFYTHLWVDPIGLGRAFLADIQAGSIVQGGSTLTMGLVRNALWLNEDRTISKKILEFIYALRIEGSLSKDQILAEYANRIQYGRLSVGIVSAAKSYFEKEIQNLTDAECLALITMAKNPSLYDPILEESNFRKRFEILANSLETQGMISTEKKSEILTEKLHFPRPKTPLPYVVSAYKSLINTANVFTNQVQTTIDSDFQKQIESIANGVLGNIAWRNVGDYGVLIADRKTHEIRALIGGMNYESKNAGQVSSIFAERQVGSTLKPFIYSMAFEKFGYTPSSPILDLPVAYETEEGTSYEPKNYSLDYRGQTTMAEALAGSINIPAIELTKKIGVENLLANLHSLGITSLNQSSEFYGLSLGLGTGEISLFELLQAYTLFSDHGNFCTLKLLPSADVCTKHMDSKYTDMIESILSDRTYKVRNFPIGSALDFPDRFAFVKTGTSRNFRDNYAIGYSDHYLIGVWTGNKDGENMKGVSGATGAGEIFGNIVRAIETESTSTLSSITSSEENHASSNNTIIGTVPNNSTWATPWSSSENITHSNYFSITNPLEFAKYKKDPGVPDAAQKIRIQFQTNFLYQSSKITLDGKVINTDFIPLSPLSIGKHSIEISLLDSEWKILLKQTRSFEVME